ncbi:hypothetical protein PNO24_00485 [Gemella haemolysans]|uniref:hypothetical protein n=1 Tax=Gemella haemolysans TaxID=1379 RepID=UPI00232FBFC2|nr:hypothetical protein [Gemella haemolysans]MDB6212403.1 hypothetical protein [Gemella haemolysans]
MVKYLVNVDFTDKDTYEQVEKGTELDITEVRAKEIIRSLGEGALTNLEEVKEEAKEEVKEEAPVVEDKKAKEVE